MANKFRNTKTMRDAYKLYKSEYPGTIDYSTYASIIKTFNKQLMDKILNDAFEFEMPYRLGTLRIKKTKTWFDPKTMKVDWKKTKEIGKRVYHMNEHTNYFNFRFFWKKKTATFILDQRSQKPK